MLASLPQASDPSERSLSDFDRLVAALEDGAVIIEGGHVVGANPALARIAGFPCDDLLGKRVSDLFATADGRPVEEIAPGDVFRLRDSGGDLVPVSIRRVTDSLFLILDRSRARRHEREVWRLAAQLRLLGREPLPHYPSQEELFGMVEHEIRTATTVIQGYSRMLMDERVGSMNSTQQSFLLETRRATDRISSLLDNLLEMATLESRGALRVTREPTRLHRVVQSAVSGLRPLLLDRGVRVVLELEAAEDAIQADPERLTQVIINLLTNAAKFGGEGSEVLLRTRCEARANKPEIVLEVADEGAGVCASEVDRIFQPFVQGRPGPKGSSEGVGLGLAICRMIVEAHGGEVAADPGVGHGLFSIRLPLER